MMRTLRPFVAALWREHRAAMLVVVAASFALMLTEGIGLLLLVPTLRLVGVSVGDAASDRIAAAMDWGVAALGVPPTLAVMLGVVVVLVTARAALQWLLAWWHARLEAAVIGRLRERLFAAIVALPWARFAGERPAALVHAIGPQVDDVHSALLMLLQAISLCAVVAAAAAVALVASPVLSVMVALAGAALLGVARLLRAPGRAEGDRLLDASTGLFARISELLGGMKMIHAHEASVRAVDAVGQDTRAWSTLTQRYARRRALVSFVLAVLGVVMLAFTVWVAVMRAHLAPATLLLLLLLYARIVPRLAEIQALASALAQTLASFASVSALLARCDAERRDATSSDVRGERPRRAVPPHLELRAVSVRYPGTAVPALDTVTATFAAGALTAVVGPSGAGKTTLGDVLLGLLTPERGDMVVDGVPCGTAAELRATTRTAYLAQEPMLFHGTIRENLRFAAPDADDAAIERALREAACEFVARLPHGADAPIGDRGVLLSGGERQRLALARALLRQPQLLVLDEATSALDAETEARILDTLRALRGRCTIVFCTHRDAVRQAADHVVTL